MADRPGGLTVTLKTVSSSGAGVEKWTVSADGMSATIQGVNADVGMNGWAKRLR